MNVQNILNIINFLQFFIWIKARIISTKCRIFHRKKVGADLDPRLYTHGEGLSAQVSRPISDHYMLMALLEYAG